MPSNIGASIILKRATICMIQIKAAKAQSDYSVYGSGKFSPHYAKRGAQHMLKDILVHIPTDQRAKPIIDCAVSLAQAFDAHLDGAARIYRSCNPAIAIGASAAAMAIATQYQPDMELAAGTLDQFELAAREAGLRAVTLLQSGGSRSAGFFEIELRRCSARSSAVPVRTADTIGALYPSGAA